MYALWRGQYQPEWQPEGVSARLQVTAKLQAGCLVVCEKRPVRVLAAPVDVPVSRWQKRFEQAWEIESRRFPGVTRETWNRRPMYVQMERVDEPGRAGLPGKRWRGMASASTAWWVIEEHYSVCVRCGEMSPCSEVFNERIAKRQVAQMDELLKLVPGCCMACNEPITSRQKHTVFEGENLTRPDFGDDSAVFHLRRSCMGAVHEYDRRWAEARGVPRRFHCSGRRTVHLDKSEECSRGDDCPGAVSHDSNVYHHANARGHAGRLGCWCLAEGLA